MLSPPTFKRHPQISPNEDLSASPLICLSIEHQWLINKAEFPDVSTASMDHRSIICGMDHL